MLVAGFQTEMLKNPHCMDRDMHLFDSWVNLLLDIVVKNSLMF